MSAQTATKTKPANTAPKGAAAPNAATNDGWDDCTVPDIEGWFKAVKGATVHGKILNVMELRGDDGKLRQVLITELKAPCTTCTMDQKDIELPAGAVIGVGVSHMLQPTLQYAANQGEFKATFEEQQALKGGRKVWKGKLVCKGTKAAPPTPIGRKAREEGPADDGDYEF